MAATDMCKFCRIISGDDPATIVWKGNRTVAFLSQKPVAPVHVVVVPERHIANVAHLGVEDGPLLLDVYLNFESWAQEENLRSWRIVTNYGKQAGQRVQHLSFHFLAGRHFEWPPG